jgi:glycosyltransferase involved in cell wall biosynthesis
VAVVTNIPRPYRRALFGALKVRLTSQGRLLRVLYTSDPSKHVRRGPLLAGVDDPSMESFVGGMSLRTAYERVITLPTGLRRALRECEPLCVVSGGFGPSALIAACWCRSAQVPYVLWSGAWPGQATAVGALQSGARKWLVRKAQAFIAYGTAAADYLVSLGARSDRVFCAWNTVDLEEIASRARAAASRLSELTPKYRLAAANLLYVGTLVESKGVKELVSAALAVEAHDRDWALHLVGAGPAADELERLIRGAGKGDHFRFHGLRPPEDVAELLGVVDGLLLPTKREAWGLVINEAMACGVPVVASPWAGATRDLIVDGVTGYVVEPIDTAALANVMSRLLSGDPSCKEVGRAGAKAVRAKASLENSAEGFALAVECALSHRGSG